MTIGTRMAHMLRRQNRIDEAREEAAENGNRARWLRLIDLTRKNQDNMTRASARWRRGLT
jgi:hypothetical protein